jgi:hypothetical protein
MDEQGLISIGMVVAGTTDSAHYIHVESNLLMQIPDTSTLHSLMEQGCPHGKTISFWHQAFNGSGIW